MSNLPMIFKKIRFSVSDCFYNINFKRRILFDSLRSHQRNPLKSAKYLEITAKLGKFTVSLFEPKQAILNTSVLPMFYGSKTGPPFLFLQNLQGN